MKNITAKKSIHILGPGAMGLLWAAKCCENNWDVTLLHKNTSNIKLDEKLIFQSNRQRSEYALNQDHANTLNQPIQILLVTLKAHQLCTAIKPLLPNINRNTLIILSQNGIGAESELFNRFPVLHKNLILQLVTTHGALKISQYSVQQTGTGTCWIGYSPKFHPQNQNQPKNSALQKLLKLKMIDGWRNDLEILIWQKLIVNASINPLSAILRCKNGELLSSSLFPLLTEIVFECCSIAQRSNIPNANNSFNPDAMLNQIKKVCTDTASNNNSMLEDVIHHRKTEIKYINQYLLDIANRFGVAAPWNLCLTSILNSINHVKIGKT